MQLTLLLIISIILGSLISNLIAITVAQLNFSIISIQEVNNFATRIKILQTPTQHNNKHIRVTRTRLSLFFQFSYPLRVRVSNIYSTNAPHRIICTAQ